MKKTMKNIMEMENINVTIDSSKATRAEMLINTTPEVWGRRSIISPIDLFDIDYSYQRVRTSHVNELYDEWDNNSCDYLWVSYRDGRFFIIDGQHRYYAALAKGIKDLPCIVRTGLTAEDEARIFVELNTSRKPLSPFDVFKANIRNGNENIPGVKIDMGVKRICDKYEIKISYNNDTSAPRKLRALTSVRSIVKVYGENALDWIFETMKETSWYDCGDAYTDVMLNALKNYYGANIDNLDKAKANLAKLMTEYSPMDVVAYGDEKYTKHGYKRYTKVNNALKDLV